MNRAALSPVSRHFSLPAVRPATLRLVVLCAILLAVFAVYAPAARLMLFHDDTLIALGTLGFTPLDIFAIQPQGMANYRPVGTAVWIATRDVFGWHIPAIIHMWNVWSHTLNTALFAALVLRVSRQSGPGGIVLAALCASLFAFFPFSFQAVLWAAAVYHPFMVTFGLSALLLYRASRRRKGLAVASGFALLLACLSHEMGFVFGLFILADQVIASMTQRQRIPRAALILAALSLAYPILYRLFMNTVWTSSASVGFDLNQIAANVFYFLQGIVVWPLALLRSRLELGTTVNATLAGLFIATVTVALLLLWRAGLLHPGLLGLLWWAFAVAPSALFLTTQYVHYGPRLMYAPALGSSLFWGATLCALGRLARCRPLQAALCVAPAVLIAWSVVYIADRLNETARLTPVMTTIDRDLRQSDPSARVLFINPPMWSGAAYPAFLVGAEGMPIFQDGYPEWSWIAAINGTRRETVTVRHDISLTRGERFIYGVTGHVVDDGALRPLILSSNYVYRFDYDPPGLRVRRLATLGPLQGNPVPLAVLSRDDTRLDILDARAVGCGSRVELQLNWAISSSLAQPAGVFVHGMSAAGQQVVVADGDLLEGYLPLHVIPAGVMVAETRRVTLPPDAEAVSHFYVGVYDLAGQKRYRMQRADGSPWEGDQLTLPVIADERICRD